MAMLTRPVASLMRSRALIALVWPDVMFHDSVMIRVMMRMRMTCIYTCLFLGCLIERCRVVLYG